MLSPDVHILITGARGYIGGFLIQALKKMGMKHIFCLTSNKNQYSSHDDSVVSWIYCDIGDRNMVFDTIRKISPDYVFHLAALGAKNSISTYSFEELFLVNTLGTQNLIDATQEVGSCKSFINVSTVYEYGPHEFPISEKTSFMPEGNYAISKIAGSFYLQEKIIKENFPGINIRLFSVYGPGDRDRIIPRIIQAFLHGNELKLVDIHRKRDFVHIDTVIQTLLGFDKIQKNNINSLNVGSGESITVQELVFRVSELLGKPIPDTIFFTEGSVPALHWESDIALMRQHFPDPKKLNDGLNDIFEN